MQATSLTPNATGRTAADSAHPAGGVDTHLGADVPEPPIRAARSWLLGLACVFTLLNAVKPLTIDDTANCTYARQIAGAPLDPFGFEMFWAHAPQPANEVLTPLVVPYWVAPAVALFGEQPFFWKLWLLPIHILLVFMLDAVFRRFTGRMAPALVLATTLSPAFLPSSNVMLDVPVAAVGLAALVLFFRATDPVSVGRRLSPLVLAVLAGVVGGLAIQTKYTGFLVPAVIIAYGVSQGRASLALVAVTVTAAIFVVWEALIAWRYGQSHFMIHFLLRQEGLATKPPLTWPLITTLGGVGPGLAMLGLAAHRVRASVLAGLAAAVVAAILLVGAVQGVVGFETTPHQDLFNAEKIALVLTIPQVLFFVLGLLVIVLTTSAACQLTGLTRPWTWANVWRRRPDDCFLVIWLGLELAGYYFLSPCPAVRRVLGLLIVGTALLGRLAERTCRSAGAGRRVWAAAAFSAVLGLFFQAVDWCEAQAQKAGAEQAAAFVRQHKPTGQIWYVGHWGFQYYAERAGMVPVVPEQSKLVPGDWLVVPGPRLDQQPIDITGAPLTLVEVIEVGDVLPWQTLAGYYNNDLPLDHFSGPRLSVAVYRVTKPYRPWTPQ